MDSQVHSDVQCKYFLRNGCKIKSCPYSHDKSIFSEDCRFKSNGYCIRGDDCFFNHGNHLEDRNLFDDSIKEYDLNYHKIRRISPNQTTDEVYGPNTSDQLDGARAIMTTFSDFSPIETKGQVSANRSGSEVNSHHQHHHQRSASLCSADSYPSSTHYSVSSMPSALFSRESSPKLSSLEFSSIPADSKKTKPIPKKMARKVADFNKNFIDMCNRSQTLMSNQEKAPDELLVSPTGAVPVPKTVHSPSSNESNSDFDNLYKEYVNSSQNSGIGFLKLESTENQKEETDAKVRTVLKNKRKKEMARKCNLEIMSELKKTLELQRNERLEKKEAVKAEAAEKSGQLSMAGKLWLSKLQETFNHVDPGVVEEAFVHSYCVYEDTKEYLKTQYGEKTPETKKVNETDNLSARKQLSAREILAMDNKIKKWVETGHNLNVLYKEKRQMAECHMIQRNDMLSKSIEYLRKNMAQTALKYSKRADYHNSRMESLNNEAKKAIIESRNKEFENMSGVIMILDLHGLHKSEAIDELKHKISSLKKEKRYLALDVICGTGHHTIKNRRSVLMDTVVNFLKEQHFQFKVLPAGGRGGTVRLIL